MSAIFSQLLILKLHPGRDSLSKLRVLRCVRSVWALLQAIWRSALLELAPKRSRSSLPKRRPIHAKSIVDYGPVEPPPAFKVFCREMPERMRSSSSPRFDQSARRLEELDEVNRRVNHTISPETDIEHYGIEDYWTIPKDGKGDCEDYALLKRHLLISMGWPTSALLMTVVRTENDEGHAVLTARTNSRRSDPRQQG